MCVSTAYGQVYPPYGILNKLFPMALSFAARTTTNVKLAIGKTQVCITMYIYYQFASSLILFPNERIVTTKLIRWEST